MAISRSSGGFTFHGGWLIGLVVLWVASTAGLVIVFMNQEQVQQEADAAKKRLADIAPATALSNPQVTEMSALAKGQNQQLVPFMLGEINRLAGRITGDNTQTARRAEAELDEVLRAIREHGRYPDPNLFARSEGAARILKELYSAFAAQNIELESTRKAATDAATQLAAAQATIRDMESKFSESMDGIKTQVNDLQTAKNSYETEKSATLDDLGAKLAAAGEARGQMATDMATKERQYQKQLARSGEIIQQQMGKIGEVQGEPPVRASELSIAREPVGIVMRALPGDSLVHISLGSNDGVTLGMRFAIYASDRRVPMDGRGKANIEVVNVSPYTSECRVITAPAPDDPILENDFVQNIILSRNRSKKPRFAVMGSFDVDYDGRTDPKGIDRVKAYIERFGGEVVSEVDSTTDYLVIGNRSTGDAERAERRAIDHTAIPAAREAAKANQSLEDAVERATLLGVPRLRQDVFLNFVGMEPGPTVARRLLP